MQRRGFFSSMVAMAAGVVGLADVRKDERVEQTKHPEFECYGCTSQLGKKTVLEPWGPPNKPWFWQCPKCIARITFQRSK